MLDFRKRLSFELIENAYMKEDNRAECQRSARIRERIGHGLVSLPPWKNFSGGHLVTSMSKYPQKNAAGHAAKCEPIVYALLECPCSAIAWQVTSKIAKTILKVAS